MCVLTYFPYKEDRFVLTSNRDEQVLRLKALPPKRIKIGKNMLIAPVDPVSQGTWIATSKPYSVVLLNGGFICHKSAPPYRQSRGQVILDMATFINAEDFYENYAFDGIEPFTLVVFEHGKGREISEIRWCSGQKFFKQIDINLPEIWSSSTLYSPEAISKRKDWYFHLIAENNNQLLPKDILDFHINGGKDDNHDSINLRRSEDLKTLSTTQISIDSEGHTLVYHDFLQNINKTYRLV
jgi:Transport and Golgi organisation 2